MHICMILKIFNKCLLICQTFISLAFLRGKREILGITQQGICHLLLINFINCINVQCKINSASSVMKISIGVKKTLTIIFSNQLMKHLRELLQM